jgi:general secretion pathway protein N
MRRGTVAKPTRQSAFVATRWGESTHAELAWGRSRSSASRWAWAGAAAGSLIAVVWFAPAVWLTDALARATGSRFVLSEPRGTVWDGSGVAVLTGGAGSRDVSALPGRLGWSVRPKGMGLELRLSHDCCLRPGVALLFQPGFGRLSARLTSPPEGVGQWPSAWLGGLGTPFNTLQLGGALRLATTGLVVESVQGRWRLAGGIDLDLIGASSRLSTLDTLGSYRLSVRGEPVGASGDAASAGAANLVLSTLDGALQLDGSGAFGIGGLRFSGEARSREPDEPALNNLLNIIGRRDGARSVFSIG